MMILVTSLYRRPVVAPGSYKLGELGEPVIDPQNGKLLAFVVYGNNFFSPKKVVSIIDIIALDPNVILINKPESIIEPKEVVRIANSLKKKILLNKTKAYTQSNSYLGKLEDVVIDTQSTCISKFYLRKFLEQRILPAEKVIEIKYNKIIFDDSVNNPKTRQSQAPA